MAEGNGLAVFGHVEPYAPPAEIITPTSIAEIVQWPEQAALFGRAVERVQLKAGFRAKTVEDLIKAIDQYEVFHNLVLVMTFLHDAKIGSIWTPEKSQEEDKYQGKVGLVLKKGPLAFVNDHSTNFGLQDVLCGEWIVYRASDGYPLELAGVHCRLLEDTHIKGRMKRPDTVF